MTVERDLTCWIQRLGNGDSQAANRIWESYFGKLVQLARRKLEGVTLRSSDEEDVAVSAMYSFYRGMKERKFEWVTDREDLWKLLVTLTARKACAARRKHFAQKRGGGRVQGESFFERGNRNEDNFGEGIAAVLGKEPTPEIAAGVAETCQMMLDKLGEERLREIAVMTLEGLTPSDVAEKLGCVRRTIERKLERIRKIWAE
ncbi:MAG: helix-turn-helix domain-containing protein [Planctomycetaceae bacterium]|jgi:DNA-directed RNA polymerase specialized sigma24 family protein|nr:helix-turn-helix domain-containing protein [Planctomycetaceae bacterium]